MTTFCPFFPETAGSRGVAFVVDDDQQVRGYIKTVLEAQHYIVTSFGKPSDALDALIGANGDVSILISDVEMPEMSGIIFATEALRHFPELPVLMISGRPDSDNRDSPLPFLLKPFPPGALKAAVEQVCAAQSARHEATLPSMRVGSGRSARFQPPHASARSTGGRLAF